MRILYVEDEKFLADAVIHVLDKSGISVDWTADGEEGLDLAVKPIYDAIVLDVMLPGISGFDILKLCVNAISRRLLLCFLHYLRRKTKSRV